MQTTADHRLSRRFALKGAGLLAAAIAVPAAAVAAPAIAEASAEPEIIHELACFHRVHKVSGADAERDRLADEFERMVPDDVWSLHDRILNLDASVLYEEQNRFVDELCRHFPGLAPAIRYIGYHHINDQRLDDIGACCEDCDPDRCPGGGPTPAA